MLNNFMNPWVLLILLVIALLVFGGRGRIPQLMRDMGRGITAFRTGLKEDDAKTESDDGKTIEQAAAKTTRDPENGSESRSEAASAKETSKNG